MFTKRALQESYALQAYAGQWSSFQKQKKKCKNLTTRIQNIIDKYEEYSIIDYLKGIAYNLTF